MGEAHTSLRALGCTTRAYRKAICESCNIDTKSYWVRLGIHTGGMAQNSVNEPYPEILNCKASEALRLNSYSARQGIAIVAAVPGSSGSLK